MRSRTAIRICWTLTLVATLGQVGAAEEQPSFARDVRPILARYCFKCHGPDDLQRQAGLRLDQFAAATSALDSGSHAIVPGQPQQSELVRRISSADPEVVMPPPTTQNALNDSQRETLRRWISGGAIYEPHWSFIAPQRPPLPNVENPGWCRSPIDRFISARQQSLELRPAPPAKRPELARRASLDLIGLPPSIAEVEQFDGDELPDAMERYVDQLLASNGYGERWARRWLDLARYADTNGYEKDRARSIWPYRDWVIRALNRDLSFRDFTIDQLAGDMLPNPTQDQRVATGFHRNTMVNEEGGIDPLEFRFHAMTDRVATTGTVWLGLTLGCGQCHSHKYDPIQHTDYYRFLALLNNADEPEIEVPQSHLREPRRKIEAEIAERESRLFEQFPTDDPILWHSPRPAQISLASKATAEILPAGELRISGEVPEVDTYTVAYMAPAATISALRLDALTDSSLGGMGPGRTAHGNFVLTEIRVVVEYADGSSRALKVASAEADASQDGFSAAATFDGNPRTGWAIHLPGEWNVTRHVTYTLSEPIVPEGVVRWVVTLDQTYGGQHTLGKFAIRFGEVRPVDRPVELARREHFDRKFQEWAGREATPAQRWTTLTPISASSNLPLLTVQDDASVFVSGDQSKSDMYQVRFRAPPGPIAAIRLEVLPDDRLPKRGPGRVYYEGPFGDFFLSDLTVLAGSASQELTSRKISRAAQSFANGGNNAAAAIDDNKQTGWSIQGGQGRRHVAVFNLAEPIQGSEILEVRLLCERYYAAGIGRFRISVTDNPAAVPNDLPDEVLAALQLPTEHRSTAQQELLERQFLLVTPAVAAAREQIQQLRNQLQNVPTSLVMQERDPGQSRPTYRHHRGEYLQPKERVEPGVLAALLPLPPGVAANRLTLAKWLVDPRNPLTSRVTVNRHWATLFGRGLVRTTDDFGLQGELPSHPELLDWMATEFSGLGLPDTSTRWSPKRLHRLLVLSASYQQSSQVTVQQVQIDPGNTLLSRSPRFRLEAEQLRDTALATADLLTRVTGGPSVFPPQPAGVSTEGTYGGLAWTVSPGGDRYRRGLYTYTKRTAPYAMFSTFDAPSGEACVARRELSNTPLQALTLLNDPVLVEASQSLGRILAARMPDLTPPSDERLAENVQFLFRKALSRQADRRELVAIARFYQAQHARLITKEIDPLAVLGAPDATVEQAAWTIVARAVLNLDEAVTRN